MNRIGIIGVGSMGGAIARGLLEAGTVRPGQLAVCDPRVEALEALSEAWPGITCVTAADALCELSQMIILAVKPYLAEQVIGQCGDALADKAVVSIAAGVTAAKLKAMLEPLGARWLRVMPNTPALVGEGMTALCAEHTLTSEEMDFARRVFDSLGKTTVLPERMFDGVIAVSGSSPAYVYMMIEAMADAGVREGIPWAEACRMAAQSVLGSALMVLNTGTHPAALRNAVCSPAGTTIDAVAELEARGFRTAVMEAMRACADKSRAMGKAD
ncbi:MAG: pyrroline-5-carboxylate reductase [Clostridia bacterium]|nr:pyrroline-5-carboxylate reductase [Clostridia bacterium]